MIDLKLILLKRAGKAPPVPVRVVNPATWPQLQQQLPKHAQNWAKAQNFTGNAGAVLQIAQENGTIAEVIVGSNGTINGFALGKLCRQLPPALYSFENLEHHVARHATLAWCLEAYNFDRYKPQNQDIARLVCASSVDFEDTLRRARATYFVRDLINTPANDFGPDELEAVARKLATSHGVDMTVVKGGALQRGFPMIHAVGQASPRQPRLLDFAWGPARAPKVTLVGKGVCFDTGGLDIKAASGMALMKKDMGGAANVLGLAQMIMEAKLTVRLRVLIPAVENAISGNAFRPGDILKSRKGLTVEIGNTDAEGRLVLGDALSLADDETPDLLIDMATLTGAARVALGPELPPFYTNDEALAVDLMRLAASENDPLWRMPFWEPYNSMFDSPVAHMNNSSDSGFAGSITAALFLKRFVEKAKSYVHFDVFGWAPFARPGSPKGGEAQAIRALFSLISERYKK